jgi:hypothetical protein
VESTVGQYRFDTYTESAFNTAEEESPGLPTIFNAMPIDPLGLGGSAYLGTRMQATDSLCASSPAC